MLVFMSLYSYKYGPTKLFSLIDELQNGFVQLIRVQLNIQVLNYSILIGCP